METSQKILKTLKNGVLKNKKYTLTPVDCKIKLNQNESPFDLPSEFKQKITDKLMNSKWNIYPDFIPDDIYEKIAAFYGYKKENLLIGNGSNEMILTILASTIETSKKIIISIPTFTVYGLISSNLNANLRLIKLNSDFSFNITEILKECKEEGSVTIICSPNNPTGTFIKKADIEKIAAESGGLVIVDEAYIHFGGESVLDLIRIYPNLVVLRTFSKAFGLAGLRIGMMFSDAGLIGELAKVKLPYNLNIFTIAVLDEIFNTPGYIDDNIKKIIDERTFLERELSKIKKIKIIPSNANFFLVKFEDSRLVFDELVKSGILVRDFSRYPMLENHLRISVGNRNENIALVDALKTIIK
jgi:histidinol-phosphate aminotransferase